VAGAEQGEQQMARLDAAAAALGLRTGLGPGDRRARRADGAQARRRPGR